MADDAAQGKASQIIEEISRDTGVAAEDVAKVVGKLGVDKAVEGHDDEVTMEILRRGIHDMPL